MATMATKRATSTNKIAGAAQAACCLAMFLALAAMAPTAQSAEPKGDAKPENKLVGTWKLVSAKYGDQEAKFEEGETMVKHITPSQFMWATYDKDGKVFRAAGGDYTLKGEVYEEIPMYGLGSDFDLIKGKAHTFKCRVEGNRWYHNGKLSSGLTIDEVWERVDKKQP